MKKGKENENYLATMGIGEDNHGQYSLYELLQVQNPYERFATAVHESAHAYSPRIEQNAEHFGSEAERKEASRFVESVAVQSLNSDVMLDGYHRKLATDLSKGKISYETFVEETSAILSELAMVNRAKVFQIQAEQRKWHEDEVRAARATGRPAPAPWEELITPNSKEAAEPVGIDKTLVTLLEGINGHDELLAHAANLKQRFYAPDAAHKAWYRFTTQYPLVVERIDYDEHAAQIAADMAHFEAEYRRLTNKDKQDGKKKYVSQSGESAK